MNVIYSLSGLFDWIEIAKNMKEKNGWEPILWLTTDALITSIQKTFPQCKIEEYMAANRGEVSLFSFKEEYEPLDAQKVKYYVQYEKAVVKMMDRVDPTQRNFTYNERVQHYYNLLSYWIFILDNYKIDLILFNEMPHSAIDFILYAVAKEKKIKILRFTPTHIAGRILLYNELEDIPTYFEQIPEDKDLDEEIQAYISKLEGDYKQAVPFYMKDISDIPPLYQSLLKNIRQGWKYVISPPSSPLKGKEKFISNMKFSGIYLGYYRLLGNLYKKRLQKNYDLLTTKVNLSNKYVYVPLHYQPEKTTSPEGDIFVDQYLMIAMLSKMAPKGWKIYVKEHISQFSTKLYGERGRTISFYKNLKALGNVELVPLTYESFDLLDNAQVLATVTGTAALEAVIRGRYALIFGFPWFRACEGMIPIKKNNDLIKAFSMIENNTVISKEKIKDFFKIIDQNSMIGYTGEGMHKYLPHITKERNIENLTKLLEQYTKEYNEKV